MPHTDKEIEAAAARLEERLANLDLDRVEVKDTYQLRAIAEAAEAARKAEADVRERVELARASGVSWNRIGVALGVSRQAARQRYSSRRPGSTPVGTRGASTTTRQSRRAKS